MQLVAFSKVNSLCQVFTLVLHNARQVAHDVISLIHKISIRPAEFVIQQLYD